MRNRTPPKKKTVSHPHRYKLDLVRVPECKEFTRLCEQIAVLHQQSIGHGCLSGKDLKSLTVSSNLLLSEAAYRLPQYSQFLSPERLGYMRKLVRTHHMFAEDLRPYTVEMMLKDDIWALGCIWALWKGFELYDVSLAKAYLEDGQQYHLDKLRAQLPKIPLLEWDLLEWDYEKRPTIHEVLSFIK